MRIKQALKHFGALYLCCLISNYDSPIFLKKEDSGINRINYRDWEKISSKINGPKTRKKIVMDEEVRTFLESLCPTLETHKERRIRTFRPRKV